MTSRFKRWFSKGGTVDVNYVADDSSDCSEQPQIVYLNPREVLTYGPSSGHTLFKIRSGKVTIFVVADTIENALTRLNETEKSAIINVEILSRGVRIHEALQTGD